MIASVAANYASRAEAKGWLGVATSDTSRDEEIDAALEAASVAIANFCRGDLALGATTETLRGHGDKKVFVSRKPVASVTSCTVDGTAVPVELVNGEVWRVDRMPFPFDSTVIVTYSAGFDPIPAPVKLATKMTVQALWTAPAMEVNFQSDSMNGVVAGSFRQEGPGSIPPAAIAYLRPYRNVVPF